MRTKVIKAISKLIHPHSSITIYDNCKKIGDNPNVLALDSRYLLEAIAHRRDNQKYLFENFEQIVVNYLIFCCKHSCMSLNEIHAIVNELVESPINKNHIAIDCFAIRFKWYFYKLDSTMIYSNTNYQNLSVNLMIISSCYELGDYGTGTTLLKNYLSIHGLKDIEKSLPLSKYSFDLGYYNEATTKSAEIFNWINTHQFDFNSYPEICIIGNSPIKDDYDLNSTACVIRFNYAYCAKSYPTTVWVRNCDPSFLDYYSKTDVSALSGVFTDKDIWHHFFDENTLADFYKYVCNGIAITYPKYLGEIHSTLGIKPSSGFIVVYELLKTYTGKVSLFGFSHGKSDFFTHEGRSEIEDSINSLRHDLSVEYEFFKANNLL